MLTENTQAWKVKLSDDLTWTCPLERQTDNTMLPTTFYSYVFGIVRALLTKVKGSVHTVVGRRLSFRPNPSVRRQRMIRQEFRGIWIASRRRLPFTMSVVAMVALQFTFGTASLWA